MSTSPIRFATTPVFDRRLQGSAIGRAAADEAWVLRSIPWLAMTLVAGWVATGMAFDSAQWGDHFEQFTWAHSVEWGYHKHPPLPTWLLAAAIGVFGPSPAWPSVLAAACAIGNAGFTFAIARRLLGPGVAGLALLLWGLQQPFSARANLFNHNTVLMVAVSATAWCVLRALASERRARGWWLATGLAAGAAMLAKYQAVLPLAGIVLALALDGRLADLRVRRGLACAVLVAAALFAPHFAWMVEHRFGTLDYAMQHGQTLDGPGRAWNVVSFLAQQIRLVFPALLFAGLLALLPGPAADPERRAGEAAAAQTRRAWLTGLLVFPLLATVATGPLLGIALQNHWGYQALQFGALWLAWRVRRHAVVAGPAWIGLALLLHAVFLAVTVLPAANSGGSARIDSRYPAQALADAVRRDWKDSSLCPLSIVVGPSFEAGMVSVYGDGRARVLEDGDFTKSPWITPDQLLRMGATYISTSASRLPLAGATRVGSIDVGGVAPLGNSRIYWAIVPPETCAVDAGSGE